jgi:hypothetical protein
MSKRVADIAVAKIEKKHRAKEKALERAEKLITQIYSKGPDHAAVLFFQTVHGFFGDFCNIRYQFTYSELIAEIRRRKLFDEYLRKVVLEFVERLQEKEFSNTEFSKEELLHYTKDFKAIVNACSTEEVFEPGQQRKTTWRNRFTLWLHGIRRRFRQSDVARIVSLLGMADKALNERDLERSQRVYKEIDRIYQQLSAEEKKVVYTSIKSLYHAIEEMHGNQLLERLEEQQRNFYSSLESNDLVDARKLYEESEKLYESMPAHFKKRIYGEMRRMHSKVQEDLFRDREVDVKRLLTQAVQNLEGQNISLAAKNYQDAQQAYNELPATIQKRVYEKLQAVYHKISQAN